MKQASDQAAVLTLPSILDIVKDFMIEEGFNPDFIKVNQRTLMYGSDDQRWCFAGLDSAHNDSLYVLTLNGNQLVRLNPADQEFFKRLRDALVLPGRDNWLSDMWYDSDGKRKSIWPRT